MLIADTILIDEAEIEERFIRASGPGGQHVNKTESAVQLRFDLAGNTTLPEVAKRRLVRLAGSRMTKDGALVLRADTHRERERNRAEARDRLRKLIEQALIAPKPRKKARPSLASMKRVKTAKAQKSQRKSLRKRPGSED
ncbi:alternative ribosome rescue aminoacyl-tRNA hydrolase ArfB [uncultured Maricaulis sp.]|uniref:alternative ribosome rescue aminoacyl-tRNA hydrolase ArfB n=1 Tax=uncultured Maricaulis sp. TaxID=174710 RepID=UPI002612EA0F|nr:alternative ribosome rescue aminoacyl-tRNA hydrolase ArfB [uncultured Maricaulis sp.]